MPRALLERSLQELIDGVLELGSMVDKAIHDSVDALKRRDVEEAERIVRDDDLIDAKRFALEEKVIELLATQQPMAQDLRTILVLLFVTNELERMGDYAEGISKINVMMGDEPLLKPLIDVPRMADKATDMMRRSLDALVRRDVDEAYRICDDDDEVDALYDQVYRELITFMIQDPRTINRATWLLWVAHDLERIADRATNIAERVVFLVTGKLVEVNVSKY